VRMLPVYTINDIARRHGHYPDLLPGQHNHVNFDIKELHAFAEDLLEAAAAPEILHPASPLLPQQGGEQTDIPRTMKHHALLAGYAEGTDHYFHFENGFTKAAEIYAAVLPQVGEAIPPVDDIFSIGHGHVIPRQDGAKARCGGPAFCKLCQKENAAPAGFGMAKAVAPEEQHYDDYAVDCFAKMMKAKLAKKRAEGRGGWQDPDQCSVEYLSTLLHAHVAKGDPVDVANFCMMIRHYQAPISAPVAEALPVAAETADQWYLQDTRSYTGNDVMWWAKDGKGYTSDINKAHVYEREEAFRQAAMRGTDRAWLKAYIDTKTRPAVDMQYINHAEAIAMQGEKA
jgi:hypothetical protein